MRQDINFIMIRIRMYQHQIVILVLRVIKHPTFIQEEYLQLLTTIHLLQQLPVVIL